MTTGDDVRGEMGRPAHALRAGRVVVRWARADAAVLDGAAPDLGGPERARLAALQDEADRRRFVAARLLVRAAVSEVTGCRFEEVVLEQRCDRCGGSGHGPPVVGVGGRPGPSVSITHAGDLAAVALGAKAVGIDVEPTHPGATGEALAELRTWVRTEAVLKATGLGVDLDPSPVELGPADQPPRIVRWSGPGRSPAPKIADVALAANHVAAVARLGLRRLVVDVAPVDLGAFA